MSRAEAIVASATPSLAMLGLCSVLRILEAP
jgi:hypothetical protein